MSVARLAPADMPPHALVVARADEPAVGKPVAIIAYTDGTPVWVICQAP